MPLWTQSRPSGKRYEMADKPAELEHDAGFASDLALALERGQFFLVYQPTIDLETNGFAGVEALLRWRHPERGVLGPDLFIADLDRTGEIAAVGRWALVTACRDGASWHDKGYRFNVSVNISRRQFVSDQFFEDVANALSASRFDPALLALEFTQGTLAEDRDDSIARLARLRSLGVLFAVDDFEPGESAIEELEEFFIDIVKLDRQFIAGVTTSTDAASLVQALVQMSETRHLQVIASGIEDMEQRTRLQNEKIQVGQGYLFSKPHEAAQIDRYLEDFAIFSGRPL
jgi:EAL domain-containing protein (putative c-di-GMP-specific phosphodiesterase class I)